MIRTMRARSGLTLVEVAVVLAISGVIGATIFAVLAAVIKGDDSMRTRIDMQLEAAEVVRRVAETIRNSGPAEIGAANNTWSTGEYPVFGQDATGFPQDTVTSTLGDPDFLNAGNTAITPVSPSSDPEGYGGPSVEMAFRLPKDNGSGNDSDKYPTTPAGVIEWGDEDSATSPVYYAFVVTPGDVKSARGVIENELQLRAFSANGALVRKVVLSSGVERITFQTSGAANSFYQSPDTDSSLGPNQVRITVWFLKSDRDGKPVRMQHSMTVNFRSIQR